MYEYIKGNKIQSNEHMLSASEIATMYGIQTEKGKPHSLMITAILKEYVNKTNLNVAEYYYPHGKGCMRVYPELLWKPAMSNFMYYNDTDIKEINVYKIDSDKRKFVYIINKKQQKVINIIERRKHNGY